MLMFYLPVDGQRSQWLPRSFWLLLYFKLNENVFEICRNLQKKAANVGAKFELCCLQTKIAIALSVTTRQTLLFPQDRWPGAKSALWQMNKTRGSALLLTKKISHCCCFHSFFRKMSGNSCSSSSIPADISGSSLFFFFCCSQVFSSSSSTRLLLVDVHDTIFGIKMKKG